MQDAVYLILYNKHFENSVLWHGVGKTWGQSYWKKGKYFSFELTYSDVTQGFTWFSENNNDISKFQNKKDDFVYFIWI